jgi:hypothetical protein
VSGEKRSRRAVLEAIGAEVDLDRRSLPAEHVPDLALFERDVTRGVLGRLDRDPRDAVVLVVTVDGADPGVDPEVVLVAQLVLEVWIPQDEAVGPPGSRVLERDVIVGSVGLAVGRLVGELEVTGSGVEVPHRHRDVRVEVGDEVVVDVEVDHSLWIAGFEIGPPALLPLMGFDRQVLVAAADRR